MFKERINNFITDHVIKNCISTNNNWIFMLFSVVTVGIVQSNVLFSFFFSDDFLHLYQICNWPALEFIFSSHGGHLYITRNLIFLVMYKLFGMNATYYFIVVLMTHLISTSILFILIKYITKNSLIAVACSTIWGISPVNYFTLHWYSAFGHVLIGPFYLLFLYDLFRIKNDEFNFSFLFTFKWSLYFFIIATSFGIGLGFVCISPIIILILFNNHRDKWKIIRSIIPALIIILILFLFNNNIYLLIKGKNTELINPNKDIIFNNIKAILLIAEMSIKMATYAIYSIICLPLFIFKSCNKLNIIAYIVALIILFLCIYITLTNVKHRHYYLILIIYSIIFIGITAYARAPFYAIFGVPMEKASIEPRYFYILLINTVLIISLLVKDLSALFPNINKYFIISILILLLCLPIAAKISITNDKNFKIPKKIKHEYKKSVKQLKNEILVYPEGATVKLDNKLKENLHLFLIQPKDFPGKAAVFMMNYADNNAYGRKIYFKEKDKDILDFNIQKHEWRISKLLIPFQSIK